jgi:hypothetical protein
LKGNDNDFVLQVSHLYNHYHNHYRPFARDIYGIFCSFPQHLQFSDLRKVPQGAAVNALLENLGPAPIAHFSHSQNASYMSLHSCHKCRNRAIQRLWPCFVRKAHHRLKCRATMSDF